jgi:predicted ester cyclase
MMTEQAKATARNFIEEQDRLRGGPSDELCSEDYVAYLANLPPMDLAGHKAFSAVFYAAFPDLKHNIEDVVAEGDRVALRIRFTGTNIESFMGNPASGRPVDFDALVLMRIASGKVKELRSQFDQMGVLAQIGALSTPGADVPIARR